MFLLLSCTQEQAKESVAKVTITPAPQKILYRAGNISFGKGIWVVTDVSNEVTAGLATYLKGALTALGPHEVYIGDLYSTRKHKQAIHLILDHNILPGNPQAYTLEITSPQIKIKAATAQGIFYGIQSLLQVLANGRTKTGFVIPKITVKDQPRYRIRGIVLNKLDNNKESKALLKQMAGLKLNTLFVKTATKPANEVSELAREYYLVLQYGGQIPDDLVVIPGNKINKPLPPTIGPENFTGILLDPGKNNTKPLPSGLKALANLAWNGKTTTVK